jgi:hypothetical protein
MDLLAIKVALIEVKMEVIVGSDVFNGLLSV